MATYGHPMPAAVGILFDKHQDNQHLIRWQRRDLNTGKLASGDTASLENPTVELLSPYGKMWASYPAVPDADGFLHIGAPKTLFEDPAWYGRLVGTYRVTAKLDGVAIVLAHGELRLQ